MTSGVDNPGVCIVDGCDRERKARSLCMRHYTKARRRGEFLAFASRCHICKRPLKDHAVGEFCELIERHAAYLAS